MLRVVLASRSSWPLRRTMRRRSRPATLLVTPHAARQRGLKSYQADLHVDVTTQDFPFLSPSLDGNAYFKQPDKKAVVFDTVPVARAAVQEGLSAARAAGGVAASSTT